MLKEALNAGRPARTLLPSLKKEDLELIRSLNLLTLKPVLYIANIDESGNKAELETVQAIAEEEGAQAVGICAKIEAEITELLPEDAQEFLKETGLEETGLQRLVKAGYQLLGLITFFTANQKECRAWTIKKGTRAREAAGKVHTDMQRGFIAAEVIHYMDLIESGSPSDVKERGLLHLEGKEYIVQDGDLILIKFNV
jgi:ribosome-binding ATPase YchF (GTP1/OBG family)